MTVAQAVLLGAIQGLTEFFPVSSSGHLAILQAVFGLREMVAFDVFLHLGTLGAIGIYFARDIARLFTTDRSTLRLLALASVPTFIAGFFCKDAVEALFTAPRTVGAMLVVTGVVLGAATWYGRRAARAGRTREPGPLSAFAVGVAQGIAIVPGISRSGATIAAGIFAGFEREKAFRFAFLLSIPAVGGATLLKAAKIGAALVGPDAPAFLAGGAVALAVSLATIGVLRRVVVADRLYLFGIYCIIAGCLVSALVK